MSSNRQRLLVASLLAMTAIGAGSLTSCGTGADQAGKPPGGMPLMPVGVASPIARHLPVTRELTGRLEAIESVEIRPRVSGQVMKVLVADGAEVKAGDPLFAIDDAPFLATHEKLDADVTRSQSEIDRASAEIARSNALLAQAVSTRDRNLKLVADRIISQQQFDDSVATVDSAKASVAAANAARASALAALAASRAALVSVNLDLEHTHVTAPISGRIGRVLTTAGNQVQGGGPAQATLMATVVKFDPLYAVFDLDEQTWHAIGARLRTSASGGDAVPVLIGQAGETGYPHQGRVTVIDNQIDPASGSIRLRATLDNADRMLTPGAFVRVLLETAQPRDVLLVHERAVLAQLTSRYVFTVDDKGITAIRPVTLGEKVGDLRVVTGLTADDRLAVNNLAKIFMPGMPVAPMPASMETLQNLAAPGQPAEAPAAIEKNEGKKQ